jgi:hypothetical protein
MMKNKANHKRLPQPAKRGGSTQIGVEHTEKTLRKPCVRREILFQHRLGDADSTAGDTRKRLSLGDDADKFIAGAGRHDEDAAGNGKIDGREHGMRAGGIGVDVFGVEKKFSVGALLRCDTQQIRKEIGAIELKFNRIKRMTGRLRRCATGLTMALAESLTRQRDALFQKLMLKHWAAPRADGDEKDLRAAACLRPHSALMQLLCRING